VRRRACRPEAALSVVQASVLPMEKCVAGRHFVGPGVGEHLFLTLRVPYGCTPTPPCCVQVSVLLTEDNVILVDIRPEEGHASAFATHCCVH
jgi:hypothetical protein